MKASSKNTLPCRASKNRGARISAVGSNDAPRTCNEAHTANVNTAMVPNKPANSQ